MDLKEQKSKEYACYYNITRNFINFMCKKGCKFYDNGCTKNRVVRVCARKGLKNKE